MSTIKLNSEALLGVNKAGTLKPDAQGWYDVILGALEYPNSYGAVYKTDPVQEILNGDSIFARRLRKGCLIGELGHPMPETGQSEQEYLARVMRIEEKCESHTIKEVVIDTTLKDVKGNRYIGIRGKIKPSGPYGRVLEQKFADPDMNVCFSVRSFTRDKFANGRLEKYTTSIVTWDCVGEPGLEKANKYNSPSLESYAMTVDPTALRAIATRRTGMGFESADVVDLAKEVLKGSSVAVKRESIRADYSTPDWHSKW